MVKTDDFNPSSKYKRQKLRILSHLQIGAYAGGGGVSACTGAKGGNGGQQGQPVNGACGGSVSGRAGTESQGGEGG